MENKLLDHTLDHAFKALRRVSPKQLKQLSLLECGLLLNSLPDITELVRLRAWLADRLYEQLCPEWIERGDLSEVFSTLTALWQYDQTRVSGGCLAGAIKRLIQCEVAVGGPYYSGGKVELEANLYIASFARLAAKPLPDVEAFCERVIASADIANDNFTNPYLLYVFARAHNSPATNRLTQRQLRMPTQKAIALPVLRNEASKAKAAVTAICKAQQSTGFWTGEALLEGCVKSEIVTTAFIAGVLADYRQQCAQQSSEALRHRHQAVAQAAKELFETRAEPLRSSALAVVDKICRADKGYEITLFPYLFAKALKNPTKLTDRQFTMLGVASVCAWTAYTIYDDFLDGEGVPGYLPVANIAMRASLDSFKTALSTQYTFHQRVADVFTGMDEASAWEVGNCRFAINANKIVISALPKYERGMVLAARSFAHALGPLAVLIQNQKNTAKKMHYIESALKHYLIAKQLNDDIHDWYEDARTGQASYAATAVLRDMRLQPGTYNLSELLAAMQKQFRRTTLVRLCRLGLRHIAKARRDFENYGLLQTNDNIYIFLEVLEQSFQQSLDQHKKARAIMKYKYDIYRKSVSMY